MNKTDLVRIHHANYLDDIPFWKYWTERNEPVLEIGCGHGRVTIPLLEKGREVVGVDIDSDAIHSLREELGEKGLETQNRAKIFQDDIINFQPEGNFGTVIIPCNTYSTFPMEERQVIISKVYNFLNSGGVFAVSMPNPVQMRFLYEELRENVNQSGSDLETSFTHPDTGFPVQVSSSLTAREKSLGWDWIYDHLHPDGQVERVVQSTEHYLTNLETYLKELDEIGFEKIQTMGDFEESPYSEDSPYLILVGIK